VGAFAQQRRRARRRPLRIMLKTSYSVNSAAHTKKKETPDAPPEWALSRGARRNSIVAFAQTYDALNEPSSPEEKAPDLTKRRSISDATGDIATLLEIKDALLSLCKSYDTVHDWACTRGDKEHGTQGKYKISPEGDMFLLNRAAVINCAADAAMALLWDMREVTVFKIWRNVIEHCEVVAKVSPTQRILHLRWARPTMGVAGNTSARDTAVIANKYESKGPVQAIVFNSVTTSLVPEREDYVRGETKVLGFVVTALSPTTCSVALACEFAMKGAFDRPLCKAFLSCTKLDQAAAKLCSVDCNKSLKALKLALEAIEEAHDHDEPPEAVHL